MTNQPAENFWRVHNIRLVLDVGVPEFAYFPERFNPNFAPGEIYPPDEDAIISEARILNLIQDAVERIPGLEIKMIQVGSIGVDYIQIQEEEAQ